MPKCFHTRDKTSVVVGHPQLQKYTAVWYLYSVSLLVSLSVHDWRSAMVACLLPCTLVRGHPLTLTATAWHSVLRHQLSSDCEFEFAVEG